MKVGAMPTYFIVLRIIHIASINFQEFIPTAQLLRPCLLCPDTQKLYSTLSYLVNFGWTYDQRQVGVFASQ